MSRASPSRSPDRRRTIQIVAMLALFTTLSALLLYQCVFGIAQDCWAHVRRASDDRLDALLAAIEQDEPQPACRLLNSGVDVNGRDVADYTPLMRAVLWRRRDMCSLLLDHGADANASTWLGWNALMVATVKDEGAIVDLLLKRGVSVDAPTPTGRTALMVACAEGNTALAQRLIRAGANANAVSRAGATPLSEAANSPQAAALNRMLLSARSDAMTRRSAESSVGRWPQ